MTVSFQIISYLSSSWQIIVYVFRLRGSIPFVFLVFRRFIFLWVWACLIFTVLTIRKTVLTGTSESVHLNILPEEGNRFTFRNVAFSFVYFRKNGHGQTSVATSSEMRSCGVANDTASHPGRPESSTTPLSEHKIPVADSVRHRCHRPIELSNDSVRYYQTQISIFCSPNIQTGPWTHPARCSIGTGGSFLVGTAGRAWS